LGIDRRQSVTTPTTSASRGIARQQSLIPMLIGAEEWPDPMKFGCSLLFAALALSAKRAVSDELLNEALFASLRQAGRPWLNLSNG
jgi:hypothetical protein